MEVSALKYSGGIGLHARSPLLRLQSDERLVSMVRRGNNSAFEVLVSRYENRLLAFCRHLLGSREDAEDVLQEVLASAYNAMLADQRAINVKPWLYRIARNRSLNHLRRNQAIASDQMDAHLSENGLSTADKVHERETFRLLVGDIHELPETQKAALVLREMDALSYDQIAEAMDTSVSSVKSLLVRARVSLAEAAEARLLSCEEVRIELGEEAEGLRRRPSPLVRRHLRTCNRCDAFRRQLKETNRALTAVLPLGPLVVLRKLALAHAGHSASHSATAGTGAAAGTSAAAGGTVAGSSAGGFVSAGVGALATKAAAGLAAAALVTGAAVEVEHSGGHAHHSTGARAPLASVTPSPAPSGSEHLPLGPARRPPRPAAPRLARTTSPAAIQLASQGPAVIKRALPARRAAPVSAPRTGTSTTGSPTPGTTTTSTTTPAAPVVPPGRTQSQSDSTVLTSPGQDTQTTTTSTTATPSSPPASTPADSGSPASGTGTDGQAAHGSDVSAAPQP